LPVAITQDDHRVSARRDVIARREQTTDMRRNSERVVVVTRDQLAHRRHSTGVAANRHALRSIDAAEDGVE
jgi:hypothetical protein